MAIVPDHEIRRLIQSNEIEIDPKPNLSAYQRSSVDLKLASTFWEFDENLFNGGPTGIDIRDKSAMMTRLDSFLKRIDIADGEAYLLKPEGFVLAETRERIRLPKHLAARVEGRSSFARLGLSVHQSAPTVHPEFDNHLKLEIKNSGKFEILLRPGYSICQLIIETLTDTPGSSSSAIQ